MVDGTFSSIMEGVLWGVRNPGGVTEGVWELPDIQIGRSVGAKAKNYKIVTPNGETLTLTLTEGSRITDVQTIAGAGRNRQIDIVDVMVDNYGGDPLQWKKCKGYGYVDIDGESLLAELHWYEEPTIGKVATCAIAFITLELQALEDVKN